MAHQKTSRNPARGGRPRNPDAPRVLVQTRVHEQVKALIERDMRKEGCSEAHLVRKIILSHYDKELNHAGPPLRPKQRRP